MLVTVADADADSNSTESEYPMVAVQDCATNPEDIDPQATWMVQLEENGTMFYGVVRHKKTSFSVRFTEMLTTIKFLWPSLVITAVVHMYRSVCISSCFSSSPVVYK